MMRKPAAALFVFVFLFARTQAQNNPQATSGSWRPTIVAQHGMVAAGHPLAAEAGMRILKAGGNAIDAAIATWAVQGEVEPGMTGLGADMFILYYNAKTREVKFINGTGFAAQAATIDFYKSKGGIPDEGPLSISVSAARLTRLRSTAPNRFETCSLPPSRWRTAVSRSPNRLRAASRAAKPSS